MGGGEIRTYIHLYMLASSTRKMIFAPPTPSHLSIAQDCFNVGHGALQAEVGMIRGRARERAKDAGKNILGGL